MATGISPSLNDTELNLLFKQAQNWYDYAVNFGASGLTPPNWNDNNFSLLKKIAYYTAVAVDHNAP